MLQYLKQIWHTKDLRKKILYTIGILALYRAMIQVSIPSINLDNLAALFDTQSGGTLGAFSLLTGGSAENFSIMLMGLSPYINASIIVQLLAVVIPKLEQLSKEGEQGRAKMTKYTNWLTLPLAFLQSYGMLVLMNSSAGNLPIIESIRDPYIVLPIMLTVTTGTLIMMWLGNLITENGIGNGVSLLIMTSILSALPQAVSGALQTVSIDQTKLIPIAATAIFAILLTVLIVIVSESYKNIPISYGGKGQKMKQNFLPLRLNQAGMIPIIFAVSMIAFPTVAAQFMQNSDSESVKSIAEFINTHFNRTGVVYMVVYYILIVLFTFFYVSITFNPEQVAENIQKRGGFVPGIRPGKATSEYIGRISNRLTLFGGIFLAFVAIAPIAAQNLTAQSSGGAVPVLVSGAGLIIIVGVVLDLMRQVSAQLAMHNYNKFY
ncbi:MAG: preprotein translocase subunit SecY [Candidatus Peregrinibacteria bacterium]|nr:preprotein translocase subunit SecY [Candidatus Peregrinibacteria bacterium]MDZ4245412.1 preprotein translocase subunit SecY [Candidatus Gracilibacteria bacterium]